VDVDGDENVDDGGDMVNNGYVLIMFE